MLPLDHDSSQRRVAALSLQALLCRCTSSLASYVTDEKIRGNLLFDMGSELSLIHRVEQGNKSYYMCRINYSTWSQYYGQSLSELFSQNLKLASILAQSSASEGESLGTSSWQVFGECRAESVSEVLLAIRLYSKFVTRFDRFDDIGSLLHHGAALIITFQVRGTVSFVLHLL